MKRTSIVILLALALGALAGCDQPDGANTNDSSTMGPKDRDSAAAGSGEQKKR